jgi:hypothetical protein
MDLIPIPTYYLAIRYVQVPLAAIVFVLDITTIALVATNGNYTYGSLGWCAVVVSVFICTVSNATNDNDAELLHYRRLLGAHC